MEGVVVLVVVDGPSMKKKTIVVFTQQKGVKRGSIYSLFHNKYLENNKAMYNVHRQSLSEDQQCL